MAIPLFSVNKEVTPEQVAEAISNHSDQLLALIQSIVDAYCCTSPSNDPAKHYQVSMLVFALQALAEQQGLLCARMDEMELAVPVGGGDV